MSVDQAALRRNGFTFKQFFVAHDRCAMKVGTDGILLGAWAPVTSVQPILDIGTGSGLLALMMAQRTSCQVVIDAVELDAVAAGQALENVGASPWSERIAVHQADILQWSSSVTRRYALIISNPPYYTQGVACATPEREQARYTTTLSYQSLLNNAASRITETGLFCVVLPFQAATGFIDSAVASGWYVRNRTDVRETLGHPVRRVLLALSHTPGIVQATELVIRGKNNQYSESFCQLTRDFYLFMP